MHLPDVKKSLFIIGTELMRPKLPSGGMKLLPSVAAAALAFTSPRFGDTG